MSGQNQPWVDEYRAAPLTPDMLQEIQNLERKIKTEANEEVILIAYEHK
ncbi:hypothetical protein [Thalassobacillus hwangdonensis]|uniref:Uncharacterized protein n=1 Tax=Thalassobacillus hwangdonensis TaxID=546108 RepID=A0ABW3L3X5_9BACI